MRPDTSKLTKKRTKALRKALRRGRKAQIARNAKALDGHAFNTTWLVAVTWLTVNADRPTGLGATPLTRDVGLRNRADHEAARARAQGRASR